MALVFSPGQLAQRASFYQQLSALTAAGVTLMTALGQLHDRPPGRGYRSAISTILAQLNSGSTFKEALDATGRWLPAFDIALLSAGEQSGRLDGCFRLLAEYYEERARMARQIFGDLLYPVALIHAAVFILPFADFFLSGDWNTYLWRTLGILVPLYVALFCLIFAGQSQHGYYWQSFLERVLRFLPILGRARRELAIGRAAAALEALLGAGVTVIEGWQLAADASGSPALIRAVQRWRPMLEAGQTPAEALAESPQFPSLFANQYAAGEVSGTLDDALQRMHRYYTEEGRRKLRMVAEWTPRLIYLAVVMLIAYRIVSFWSGYYQRMSEIGSF
jgi:type II secretory pathway component PulF